jgi:hypothetical protein
VGVLARRAERETFDKLRAVSRDSQQDAGAISFFML